MNHTSFAIRLLKQIFRHSIMTLYWRTFLVIVLGAMSVPSASGQPCVPNPPVEWAGGTVYVVNDSSNVLYYAGMSVVFGNGTTNVNEGSADVPGGTPPYILGVGETAIATDFYTGDSENLYGNCVGNGDYGVWLFCTAYLLDGTPVTSANMLPIINGTPSVSGTLYFFDISSNYVDDLSDGVVDTDPCLNCGGMPVWQVSDPYMSLWLKDEPLGYQPAIGPRISCELAYKQRETVAGWNPNVFSVGLSWHFSWLSCVTLDINSNKVLHFPGGGQRTYFTTNDYLTDTILTGDTTNGFTVRYPDGHQDLYNFVVTNGNTNYTFLGAYMTARLNPQGQETQLIYTNYNAAYPVIQLQYVIDGDGRTNTIYYTSNAFSANLISQIVDPFHRTNSFAYDSGGHLTNIIDVGGISSSFLYNRTNNWVTNLTTPYGTTTFAMTDTPGGSIAPNGRSVLATLPNGANELYLYQDGEPGIAASYSSGVVPSTSPFTNMFDTNNLNLRNSFHWGPLQYSALSTTNISSFNSNHFRKAHLKHWLLTSSNAAGQTLSMECVPSPDSAGNLQGQITWYDYAGKTNTEYEGSQYMPLVVARILPNGTTSFNRTDRSPIGNVLTNASTWSAGGVVAIRTNIFSYNPTNGIDLITATNALGVQVSSNLYNGFHEPLTHYDALNQATTFIYNTNQQLVSVTLPTTLVISNIYGSDDFVTDRIAVGFATNTLTHSNDLIALFTDPLGLTITNTWDNLQRLTSCSYPDGTYITNQYTRLDLTATKDRLGNWTYYGYDQIRHKTAVTNALGNFELLSYCSCGLLESMQDALGNYTHYYYDDEARLISVDYPDSSTVDYSYNLLNQITNVTDGAGISINNWFNNQGLLTTSSNALGRAKSISYDVLDRVTNTVDLNGVSINRSYDNLNRLLTRSYPDGGVESFGYSPAGLMAYTNQIGQATYFAYDTEGRRVAETNANNQVVRCGYDSASDLVSLTDGKGDVTQWGYDIYGRCTNKVETTGATMLTFQYDADNRVTNRWSIAKGNTGYGYDNVGNLIAVIYPARTNTFAYDADNRGTNMTDAVGTTSFAWTAIGQLANETDPWTSNTVSYSYSQRHRTNLSITQPSGNSWSQTYTYDSAWRMSGLITSTESFNYQYPSSVNQYRLGSIALPDGASIANQYDSVSRLTNTSLINYWGHPLDGYGYVDNLAGQRTNITRELGLTTNKVSISYDPIGEVTSWLGKEANGTSRQNEELSYGYDAANNLQLRTNNALVQTFTVDSLNQLSNVTRTGTLTVSGALPAPPTNVTINGKIAQTNGDFTFAGTNNTLSNGTNTFTIIAQNVYGSNVTNTLSLNLPTPVNFNHDSNGNLTNDGTRSFYFDSENQLTNVMVAGQYQTVFVYDGLGRRRISTNYSWQSGTWVPTNVTRYIYDGSLVIQERDTNNNVLVTYTRGLDLSGRLRSAGGIGGLLARTDTNATTYYHSDGSGNITALIDGSQNIVARYEYDAYGRLVGMWGSLAASNLYRFSSKETHVNSGLIYYLYRFYDPNLQRWLNRDPMGERSDPNLYRAMANDAEGMYDPDGSDNFSNIGSGNNAPPSITITITPVTNPVYHSSPTYLIPAGQPLPYSPPPYITYEPTGQSCVNVQYGGNGELGALIAYAAFLTAQQALTMIATDGLGALADLVDAAGSAIANPVPSMLVRVIPNGIDATTLGAPGAADVFVTDASQLEGLNAQQISAELGIPESPNGFQVIQFPTPECGLASPVFRSNPGFIGGGLTTGGASEFVLPNGPIPSGATILIVH